jgi:CBS domain containing-hemolysin-like protein
VVGVVYLKDILLKMRKKESVNIREIMRPVLVVPQSKRIGQLLKDFQIEHQQIAVVADEYGGTKGIITMEDILEELVGEIQDEYDIETPIVEKIGEQLFTVVASAPLDPINKLLPYPIEKNDQYETLAGYLILKFGRIPNTNEKIKSQHYEFTVLKKSKNAVVLVQVRSLQNNTPQ